MAPRTAVPVDDAVIVDVDVPQSPTERAAALAALVAQANVAAASTGGVTGVALQHTTYVPTGVERSWPVSDGAAQVTVLVRASQYARQFIVDDPLNKNSRISVAEVAYRGDQVTLADDELTKLHIGQGYLTELDPE